MSRYKEREQRYSSQNGKSSVASGEGISMKDGVASYELKLSLTAEPVQTEELGLGDKDLGVGRVGAEVVGYECELVCL